MVVEAQHWLVSLARRVGLPGSASLSLPPATGVSDAWRQVALVCGTSEAELALVVASQLGMTRAQLDTAQPAASKLIPEDLALRHSVLPLRLDERTITVATANPMDLDAEQSIGFISGRRVVFSVAPPEEIRERILSTYSSDRTLEELLDRVDAEIADVVRFVGSTQTVTTETAELRAAPVVKLTNLILHTAIERGASDIHIEPMAGSGTVRFRIDGVLRHFMQVPLEVMRRVISRIKILAGLNITDRLRPQDGSARMQLRGREYDLRVSTVPMREAEKLVMRILSPHGVHRLDDLGLPTQELVGIRKLLSHQTGIVLVTGPTGSGKTTTLYAALMEMMTGETNITSVEDPVEYQIPGISQIQVEPGQGMTFASALRAVLRQDPDVIYIGEIRDLETAEIAVQASMTGHLVMATVHANDAAGVVSRLRKLGLPGSNIADTLRGAISQRLVRKVCPACVVPITDRLNAEETALAERFRVRPPVRPVGCASCGGLGYRGRMPILEVLTTTPGIQALIAREASTAELEQAAVAAGMRPILEVALDRVRSGETTLQEVARVLGGSSAGAAPAAAPEQPEVPSVTPYVLWVDDDPENRLLGRVVLEMEGFEVMEAQDGLVALDTLRSHPNCQLVILDLHMPQMGGQEFLSRIRRSFATATIPVIVLTGATSGELEMQLLQEGADDFLRKPMDTDRLLARIRAVLRRSQHQPLAPVVQHG